MTSTLYNELETNEQYTRRKDPSENNMKRKDKTIQKKTRTKTSRPQKRSRSNSQHGFRIKLL